MNNRIDLSKYKIRTDLVIEDINTKAPNNSISEELIDNVKITTIDVNDSLEKEINKKQGTYITIEFEDITNNEDNIKVSNILEKEIRKLLYKLNITNDMKCLVIGLGNRDSTADSLGPKTIDKITVTRHLFLLNTNVSSGVRNISVNCPDVMANTGIESYDIITSIIDKIKPDFLITIDALASSSIDRINKTIQLTDTGIHPGSGVGNNRKEISKETINIPVIAIGVPTVVESSIIVNDTISYLFKHLSYIKNNYNINKLIIKHNKKYLNNTTDLSQKEKKEVSGMLGELDENKKKELIQEVLTSLDYNLIVTPKEIDFLIDKLSKLISKSLNNSLHNVKE